MNPLLSILCITYNHDKFIGEAIDSWLEQKIDFKIEIVIGDDCSTDNTVLEIKKYLKSNNYIKLIERGKNIGFMNNFIDTYKQCNGKYIAICEGDDYWSDKNKLQMQVDFLENNKDYVLTHTNVFTLNNENKLTQLKPDNYCSKNNIYNKNEISTLTAVFRNFNLDFSEKWSQFMMADWPLWISLSEKGRFKYFGDKTGVWNVGRFNKYKMLMHNYIDACALIRKNVFEEVGYYDQEMPYQGHEDWEFWLRLIEAKKEFYYLTIQILSKMLVESSRQKYRF